MRPTRFGAYEKPDPGQNIISGFSPIQLIFGSLPTLKGLLVPVYYMLFP